LQQNTSFLQKQGFRITEASLLEGRTGKNMDKYKTLQNKECVKPNHFTFRAVFVGEMSQQEAPKIAKDAVIRFQHKFSSQNLCKTPWHELSLIVQECF